MTSSVKTNFFSYLLKEKTTLSRLYKEEEEEILRIAKDFLYSGFLIGSLNFDKSNYQLFDALETHNKAFFINYLIMKKSLIEIAKAFNQKKICFVVLKGMALNIEKIYPPGVRQHRDIDLLVKKEDIKKAYKILRKLKFKYGNYEAADNANYLYKHHIPPMRNEHGIILELHWRVTDVNKYEECPLTDHIIEKSRESNLVKGVYVPDLDCLMAHSLYHGISAHNLDHGPIFIFDIMQIYKFNNEKWPEGIKIIEKMGLIKSFNLVREIIEQTKNEDSLSKESMHLIDCLLDDFSWSSKKKQISLFGFEKKRFTYKELFFKFKKSHDVISNNYQVPFSSFKFWVFFFKKIIGVIKKIKL